MSRFLGAAGAVLVIRLAAAVAGQQAEQATGGAAGASDDLIRRGQYLVHHVAMCVQCHTPRTPQGDLDRDRLLKGAPIPLSSPFPGPRWAFVAPRLAGLPAGWTEEELIVFLQTGRPPGGHRADPPMPPFRMTREDAAAVAAYLKSLR